jgi:hypothetical protein
MQTQGGTDADDAILAEKRRFRARLRVDWNDDGLYTHALSDLSGDLSDVATDRALTGSAPPEIMGIEGSAAAELNFTIGGTYNAVTGPMDFTAVFSPYNGLSPLYTKAQVGSEVTYEIGVETAIGTVWYPQFIGNITVITPDRASGEVSITALDRVEKLRRPILLAPWAVSDYWLYKGRAKGQYLDTQGWIQNCLQQCNVSASPRRPTYRPELNVPDDGLDGVGIYIPFAGSIIPSVGWIDNATALSFPADNVAMYTQNGPMHSANTETKRPFALAGMGANTDGNLLKYWVADRTLTRLEGTHYVGMVINTTTGFANSTYYQTAGSFKLMEMRIGARRVLRIYVGGGQVWSTLYNEIAAVEIVGAKVNLPNNANTEVMAQWDATTSGVRLNFRVGGTSTGWVVLSGGGGPDSTYDALQGLMSIWHIQSMSDVCYAFRNVTAWPPEDTSLWRPAKYGAVLDDGTNTIAYTPAINGKDAWDVIADLASAEFGSALWDESGVFHFWNYDTIKHKQDSNARTIAVSDTNTLQITNSLDSVRNVYSVNAGKKSTAQSVVYSSNSLDSFIVPAFTARTFEIFTDDVQFTEPRMLSRYSIGTTAGTTGFPRWNDFVQHGYALQLFSGGVWAEPNFTNVTIDVTVSFDARGVMIIDCYNGWGQDARFAVNDKTDTTDSTNNSPALRIQGSKINGDVNLALSNSDRASISKYGTRSFQASGDWYQQYYNTEGLMQVLIPRTNKPIPTTQQITIPGDPRLQLGDTVQLYDPEGLGETIRVQIYGINRSFSLTGGLTDTLSVEMLRPPGVGLWDSSQYGRWDQSLIWS